MKPKQIEINYLNAYRLQREKREVHPLALGKPLDGVRMTQVAKLKLESVKEWFSIKEAVWYLFGTLPSQEHEMALLEIKRLISEYRLFLYCAKYTFEPRYEFLGREHYDYDKANLVAEFYNRLFETLPIEAAEYADLWELLEKGTLIENNDDVLLWDVYDAAFLQNDDLKRRTSYTAFRSDTNGLTRLRPFQAHLCFDVRVKKCELGFPRNELDRFIQSQNEPETMPTNEAPKGSHLAVIWGLKQMLLTGQDGNGNPIRHANVNQDAIRQALETFESQHIPRTGFGKRTIDDVFSEANRYIENRTK